MLCEIYIAKKNTWVTKVFKSGFSIIPMKDAFVKIEFSHVLLYHKPTQKSYCQSWDTNTFYLSEYLLWRNSSWFIDGDVSHLKSYDKRNIFGEYVVETKHGPVYQYLANFDSDLKPNHGGHRRGMLKLESRENPRCLGHFYWFWQDHLSIFPFDHLTHRRRREKLPRFGLGIDENSDAVTSYS